MSEKMDDNHCSPGKASYLYTYEFRPRGYIPPICKTSWRKLNPAWKEKQTAGRAGPVDLISPSVKASMLHARFT